MPTAVPHPVDVSFATTRVKRRSNRLHVFEPTFALEPVDGGVGYDRS